MAPTVAPTAGDANATCGKNQYGSEPQRREVSVHRAHRDPDMSQRISTMQANRFRQAGLSMIELMVAITISLFLLVGPGVCLRDVEPDVHGPRARLAADRERPLRNSVTRGRYRARRLLWPLFADADHSGSPARPLRQQQHGDADDRPRSLPVQGYDAPATSPITACVAAANHLAGTDIIVVRRNDSTQVAGDATTIPAGR
jgi:type IV pilus assembly protein PilW